MEQTNQPTNKHTYIHIHTHTHTQDLQNKTKLEFYCTIYSVNPSASMMYDYQSER
jgi:hypothetical protein